MIIFQGQMSDQSKKIILKKTMRIVLTYTLLLLFLLICIPVSIAIFYFELVKIFFIIGVFLFCTILVGCILILACHDQNIPQKIEIERASYIAVECEYGKTSYIKDIKDVKKVIDMGERYEIVFYFPQVTNCFCQKNLLVEGTLEEFESLFEDKLVRQTDN